MAWLAHVADAPSRPQRLQAPINQSPFFSVAARHVSAEFVGCCPRKVRDIDRVTVRIALDVRNDRVVQGLVPGAHLVCRCGATRKRVVQVALMTRGGASAALVRRPAVHFLLAHEQLDRLASHGLTDL